MAPKKVKSRKQKSPATTSTDDESQQTVDSTNGSEGWTSVASPKSNSSSQTQVGDTASRLTQVSAGSNLSLDAHSLADDSSQLSSIDTKDLDLDSDAIAALEADMDGPSGSKAPGPARVKKQQKRQDKAPAKSKAPKTTAVVEPAVPTVYRPPPDTFLDPNNLAARQPVDPITEPIRAAALLEVEAGLEDQKYMRAAAEWRADVDKRRKQWLHDHSDEIYTNQMRHQFKGWVELEADPVSLMHLHHKLNTKKMCRIISPSC